MGAGGEPLICMAPVCCLFGADIGVSAEVMLAAVDTLKSLSHEVADRWSPESVEAVTDL